MANTLKFGGEWAIKEGSALAYNDENNNFKPLPFDFTRASTATYVAEDGLIKTAASGVPRIDFLDSSEGSLKLESQRTNLITYSEDFSQWLPYQINTPLPNQGTSPDGNNNATKIFVTINRAKSVVYKSASGLGNITRSVFAKKGSADYMFFDVPSSNAGVWFNLSNGEVGTINSGTATIEDYGNGWYRCSCTANWSLDTFAIGLSDADNSTALTANKDILIWGAQSEIASYPTSYIKTEGATATRVADSCIQTVPDGIIGQTEGTIYFESTINGLQGGDMRFQLSDGSTNNWFFLNSGEATGIGVKARAYINNGNVNQFNSYSDYLSEGTHKYALAYSLNDIAFYVDGIQIALDTSATIPSCSKINLSGNVPTNASTQNLLEYSQVKLYNTRLSNSELAELTTL